MTNRVRATLFCVISTTLAIKLAAQQNQLAPANLNPTDTTAPSGDASTLVVNSGCNPTTGTRYNLEPRLNAGPQNSESVDFLPNRVSQGIDLVVGAANDQADNGLKNRMGGFDGYYVHRGGPNCSVNFEGTLSTAALNPTVVADPARDGFFLADEPLGFSPQVEVARTTAATLLSSTACPSGTQLNGTNPGCWPLVGVADFTSTNPNEQDFVNNSFIAVDPRTKGTGAGDVYVAAQIENTTNVPAVRSVQLVACSNLTLSCGSRPTGTSTVASRSDTFASFPYLQVRADGVITVSYWTLTKPFGTLPNPIDIKFVTCKPQGAPKPPLCSVPTLVATSGVIPGFAPGDNGFRDSVFPQHVDRREAGGTFTTFLVYDRCRSVVGSVKVSTEVCSKVDVVLTSSADGGATWSPPRALESAGHQFFGTIRLEALTNTTSIAYYSTQDDMFSQRAKIRLRQIPAGSTLLSEPTVLTSIATDADAGVQDVVELSAFGTVDFGDRIGLAAAGTGIAGQSKLYVHFTSTNVAGSYFGTSQPDQNNTLTSFTY